MPTIIGHHNITKGAKHWLTSPKRKELFGPLGVTNIRTFVDPQNPARVAVLMDVPDMDALMAAMQSKAAADAMAFDGVVPQSLVILVEILKLIGPITSIRTIFVDGLIGRKRQDDFACALSAAHLFPLLTQRFRYCGARDCRLSGELRKCRAYGRNDVVDPKRKFAAGHKYVG